MITGEDLVLYFFCRFFALWGLVARGEGESALRLISYIQGSDEFCERDTFSWNVSRIRLYLSTKNLSNFRIA